MQTVPSRHTYPCYSHPYRRPSSPHACPLLPTIRPTSIRRQAEPTTRHSPVLPLPTTRSLTTPLPYRHASPPPASPQRHAIPDQTVPFDRSDRPSPTHSQPHPTVSCPTSPRRTDGPSRIPSRQSLPLQRPSSLQSQPTGQVLADPALRDHPTPSSPPLIDRPQPERRTCPPTTASVNSSSGS